MKSLREIITSEDYICMKGFTIPKGTKLFVIKEGIPHPVTKTKVLVVRIDNGTGDLELMPETCVLESNKKLVGGKPK